MVRGQENARSLRLDRGGDLPGGSFRHVVGSAVLIRSEKSPHSQPESISY